MSGAPLEDIDRIRWVAWKFSSDQKHRCDFLCDTSTRFQLFEMRNRPFHRNHSQLKEQFFWFHHISGTTTLLTGYQPNELKRMCVPQSAQTFEVTVAENGWRCCWRYTLLLRVVFHLLVTINRRKKIPGEYSSLPRIWREICTYTSHLTHAECKISINVPPLCWL